MNKYEVIVDYGKPYNVFCNDYETLLEFLVKIDGYYEEYKDEYPYFEVQVYYKQKNITDVILQYFWNHKTEIIRNINNK